MNIHDIVVEHIRFNILQLLQKSKKKITEVYLLFYCVIECNATGDKINFLMRSCYKLNQLKRNCIIREHQTKIWILYMDKKIIINVLHACSGALFTENSDSFI